MSSCGSALSSAYGDETCEPEISVTAVCAGGAATGNGGVSPKFGWWPARQTPRRGRTTCERDHKAIDIGGLEVAPHPKVLNIWPQRTEGGKIGLSRLTGVN